MTESELIARWLGWREIKGEGWYSQQGKHLLCYTPDFRTSNEWAGAVLERLEQGGVNQGLDGKYRATTLCGDSWITTGPFDNWRSAVIDAALEVIRREPSATESR